MSNFFVDPVFVITGFFTVLLIFPMFVVLRKKGTDRTGRDDLFIILFTISASAFLTWAFAKSSFESNQVRLANSAMGHLKPLRKSVGSLASSLTDMSEHAKKTYSSSDFIEHGLPGIVLQVQFIRDGVDAAISDWKNSLPEEVLEQLHQYSSDDLKLRHLLHLL